jgi:Fe-S-cluster containining protein
MTVPLDYEKYKIEYLAKKQCKDFTDEDIELLINALCCEDMAPRLSGMRFIEENVQWLLSLSKCKRCGKCCLPFKLAPDYPGVIVGENDLEVICANTNHKMKMLKQKSKLGIGSLGSSPSRFLPLPCMFFESNKRSCKIYPFRPFICGIYPISDSSNGEVTINLRCEFGKEIYRKCIKYLRQEDKKGTMSPITVTDWEFAKLTPLNRTR